MHRQKESLIHPELFFRGIILGFLIAAPVGPIGVLCIRRSLAQGWAVGFASGMGAATADSLYGALGAFGLTIASSFLVHQKMWLQLLGGAFLVYLGAHTFLSRPAEPTTPSGSTAADRAGAYLTTFLLTLTNPMTILSFAAVFAGAGLGRIASGYVPAATIVLGVFAGSAFWWLLLSGASSAFRSRLGPRVLVWVNRISGGVITAFGAFSVSRALGSG